MTKLKLFNFGHPMRKKAGFCVKDNMAEKNRRQQKNRKSK